MWSSRVRFIVVGGIALSAAGGWISADPAPVVRVTSPRVAPPRPAPRVAVAPPSAPPRAPAPPSLALALPAPARGARRVTAAIHLSEDQQAMLALDPVAAARASVDATRDGKRADCKRKLPHASDAYCERILQVDGRTGVKFITIQQAFLTGRIDQDAYQAETHKVFLEHEIALEAFMPPADFLAHEGLLPGDDLFLVVMGDFQSLPAGYKMGDELFDPSIDPFANRPAGASRAASEDPALRAQKETAP